MGYDIKYVPLLVVRERLNTIDECEELKEDPYMEFYDDDVGESSLSYNFSKFDEYLYLPDVAGQTTEKIAKDIENVLEKLKKEGVCAGILEETWKRREEGGTYQTVPTDGFTPDIRVFAYHLQRLHRECQKYKRCVMLIDYSHPLRLTEEDLESKDESNDEAETIKMRKKNLSNIYYVHPTKGRVCVDNFALCTEIYVITYAKKDPTAQEWYDLCWKMPDAPPRLAIK